LFQVHVFQILHILYLFKYIIAVVEFCGRCLFDNPWNLYHLPWLNLCCLSNNVNSLFHLRFYLQPFNGYSIEWYEENLRDKAYFEQYCISCACDWRTENLYHAVNSCGQEQNNFTRYNYLLHNKSSPPRRPISYVTHFIPIFRRQNVTIYTRLSNLANLGPYPNCVWR